MLPIARCIGCGVEMPEYSMSDIIRIESEFRELMQLKSDTAEFIICKDCENKYA